MPTKTSSTNTNMSSQMLTQKAAGYMLAAANASKREAKKETPKRNKK